MPCYTSSIESIRLLKNAHLRCYPHPSSLRRTSKYASLLRISGALHLGIFEQSEKNDFFGKLLGDGEGKRVGLPHFEQCGDPFHLVRYSRVTLFRRRSGEVQRRRVQVLAPYKRDAE